MSDSLTPRSASQTFDSSAEEPYFLNNENYASSAKRRQANTHDDHEFAGINLDLSNKRMRLA